MEVTEIMYHMDSFTQCVVSFMEGLEWEAKKFNMATIIAHV